MAISSERFRVPEGSAVKLNDWPTRVEPIYESRKAYRKLLKDNVKKLSSMQDRFYAADSYALLVIFQAMDAAGKDSMIKHVMSGVNPQGTQVYSFKHPGSKDLDHDFLWRTVECLPERGRIGIFNRSYYEEVLIVRVQPEILKAERLPDDLEDAPSIWEGRFASIRDHEAHLTRNGTQVIKFFLHISPEEQARRFLSRIEEPEKNWKFSPDDLSQRAFWADYTTAYEEAISATSTTAAPWYVVPADDKRNSRLLVSDVIVRTLQELKVDYPTPDEEHLKSLAATRKQLEHELRAAGVEPPSAKADADSPSEES